MVTTSTHTLDLMVIVLHVLIHTSYLIISYHLVVVSFFHDVDGGGQPDPYSLAHLASSASPPSCQFNADKLRPLAN